MSRFGVYILVLCAACLVVSPSAYCGSPYSANGIGTVIPDDVGRSRSMGGVGVAYDGSMNLLRDNPSLLGTFDSFSFGAGVSYDHTKTYLGGEEAPLFAKTNLTMIKFVLPVWKDFVLGWGLTPYSRTDCKFRFAPGQTDPKYTDTMSSTGGINVSSAALAWSYHDVFRVGISFNYNFGTIQEDWIRSFPDSDEFFDSYTYIKKRYKGYSQTYGMLLNVTDKTSIGAGYSTKSTMSMKKIVQIGSVTSPETTLQSLDTTLPETWRFGVFSELRDRLEAGVDVSLSMWEDAAETAEERAMYSDTYRIGAGLRFTPSSRMNAPYYKTLPLSIGFRAGTLYYKSFPVVDTVEERAITAGIEFPLRSDTGVLALSFEYGVRGDKSKNGWDEDFFSFGLALSGKVK